MARSLALRLGVDESTESAEQFPAPGNSLQVPAEELLRAKGTQPITTVDDLAAETFESDEELDEFLAFTTVARHADLARALRGERAAGLSMTLSMKRRLSVADLTRQTVGEWALTGQNRRLSDLPTDYGQEG